MAHIQIADTTPEVSYTVTTASTGPYTIPFAFFEADGSDLAVYLDGELVDVADYTVTPTLGFTGGYPSGSLTFASSISNVTLTIARNMTLARQTDFPNSGPLNISALNTELDAMVARLQQVQNLISNRGLRVEAGQTVNEIDWDSLDGKAVYVSGHNLLGQAIASPLTAADQTVHYVHVEDFGATTEGVDASTVLNLALSYIRTQTSATNARKVILTGGPKVYRVDSSLNGTGISGYTNWGIQQLIIDAHCTGKVVLDLTDSRFGVFRDLHIWGDQTHQPYTGIQQARRLSDGRAAGTHHFENCTVAGYFTNACIHNAASEVSQYDKCKFWNYRNLDVDGEAWAGIFDGNGQKTCISEYEAPVAAGTSNPFNMTRLAHTEFRKVGSNGPTIFLCDYRRWTADDCYSVCNDSEHLRIYSTGGERDFTWTGHFEGEATHLVKFTGTATAKNCSGFKLVDHNPTCNTAVFGIDTLTRVDLYDLDLSIRAFSPAPSSGIFEDASKFQVVGRVIVPSSMDLLDSFGSNGFIGDFRETLDTVIKTRGRVTYSDNAGAAVGPSERNWRNSASPAANDVLGERTFEGQDDSGATVKYTRDYAQIVDPANGSKDGRRIFSGMEGNSDTEWMRLDSNGVSMGGANPVITASRHPQLRSYTVAGVPSAATAGQLIYVSNETGGATVAFSDGTNWRRVQDRAVVS